MRPRSRAAALAAALLATAMAGGGVAAAEPVKPASGGKPRDTPPPAAITLITGDRVHVVKGKDGLYGARPEAGPGRKGMTFSLRGDGKTTLRVMPADASPLVAAGKVDGSLFDVVRLMDYGYTDQRRNDLPLLVERTDKGTRTTVPGGRRTHAFSKKVGIDALVVEKKNARTLWKSLSTGGGKLGSGVKRVWLERKLRPVLDESVVQVGVPTAWGQGHTGQGVTVAVLDSGIDATHPDFAGRIATSQDFTGLPGGVRDDHGHGTHVASTIAGSGAASSGRFKGVAPDARLAIGRVCQIDGCPESAIIAGIEWAAGPAGAKVANLSLGGPNYPGVDPMEQAINAYSDRTLFVVASGNSGPAPGSVSSPASAEHALTVGAVTKTDQLASFSSRGPERVDFDSVATKPDLTAPGVDIAAARAAGTSLGTPVNDSYTRLNGTSMATPHVAGAAALLAGKNPSWQPRLIGRALTSAAKPLPGLGAYAQGTGRLDVTRAIGQDVILTPGKSIKLPWPHPAGQSVARCIEVRNAKAAPVTLTMQANSLTKAGQPGPAGLYSLDRTSVTVPPGESTCVTLTARADGIAGGHYYAEVIARTSDGVTQARSVTGTFVEPQTQDVSLSAIGLTGGSAWLDAMMVNTDTQEAFSVSGGETYRLPTGTYFVGGQLTDTANAHATLLARLVEVGGSPVQVTADARQAKPAGVTVEDQGAVAHTTTMGINYRFPSGSNWFHAIQAARDGQIRDLRVLPAQATGLTYVSQTRWIKQGQASTPYRWDVLDIRRDGIPQTPGLHARKQDMAHLRTTYRAQGVAAPGALYRTIKIPDTIFQWGYISSTDQAMQLPATVDEYFTPGTDVQWYHLFGGYVGPSTGTMLFQPFGPGFEKRDYGADTWNHAPLQPSFNPSFEYDMAIYPPHRISRGLRAINYEHGSFFGDASGKRAGAFGTESATLTRNGQPVTREQPGLYHSRFTVPTGQANYVLTVKGDRSGYGEQLSPRAESVWTFATDPSTEQTLPVPLAHVDIPTGLDTYNRAGAWGNTILCGRTLTALGTTPNPISAFTMQASFNDGQTWINVSTANTGCPAGQRAFSAWNSTSSGYVSLRANVTDNAGNKNTTTIIRAYKVGT